MANATTGNPTAGNPVESSADRGFPGEPRDGACRGGPPGTPRAPGVSGLPGVSGVPGTAADVPVNAVMTRPVVAVTPRDTLAHAWDLMYRQGIHHLVVVDGVRVIGLVDDRLLSAIWPLGPREPYQHTVGEVVRVGVHCVLPDTPIRIVAQVMLRTRRDAVPVVTGTGAVLGVVTATDLVALLAAG